MGREMWRCNEDGGLLKLRARDQEDSGVILRTLGGVRMWGAWEDGRGEHLLSHVEVEGGVVQGGPGMDAQEAFGEAHQITNKVLLHFISATKRFKCKKSPKMLELNNKMPQLKAQMLTLSSPLL